MSNFASREFIFAAFCIISSTVALFALDKVGMTEWVSAVGVISGIFSASKTIQKIKGCEDVAVAQADKSPAL